MRLGRSSLWVIAASLAGGVIVVRALGPIASARDLRPYWPALLLAMLAYAAFAALRGVRFRLLLGAPRRWSDAVAVGWLYSAACSLLPGGAGEVSLPLMWRSRPGGAASGTAATVVGRVQDLLSWLGVVAVVGLTPAALPAGVRALLPLPLAATLAAGVLLLHPGWRRRLLGLLDRPRLATVHRFLREVDEQLGSMAGSGGAWLATLGLRALSVLKYWLALRAFGVIVPWPAAAVGGALVALLLTVPLQGLAGIGTVEAGWVGALRLFGVGWPAAAAAALGMHAFLLAGALALGATATIRLPLRRGARRPVGVRA